MSENWAPRYRRSRPGRWRTVRQAPPGAVRVEGAYLVDATMAWVIDRAQILDLTARYNRCFDDGDAEGYAANFTEDGSMAVEGGPTTTGRAALAEMVRRTPYGIVHVTVDPIIEVDGDHATQDVTLLVLARPGPDSPPDKKRSRLQKTGRYHDELVRTTEGWKFRRRTATLDGGL